MRENAVQRHLLDAKINTLRHNKFKKYLITILLLTLYNLVGLVFSYRYLNCWLVLSMIVLENIVLYYKNKKAILVMYIDKSISIGIKNYINHKYNINDKSLDNIGLDMIIKYNNIIRLYSKLIYSYIFINISIVILVILRMILRY